MFVSAKRIAGFALGILITSALPAFSQPPRVDSSTQPSQAISVRCVDITGTTFEACGGSGGGASGGLTDTQLRATPVPVSGTFFQAIQPVSQSGTWNVGLSAGSNAIGSITNTSFNVGNFPASQAVTGTFWQTTQPVSGTFFQSIQPVSQSGTWNVGLSAGVNSIGSISNTSFNVGNFPASQAVTGTFFQGTQPVSLATLPALTAGSAVIGHVITDTGSTTVVTGTVATTLASTTLTGTSAVNLTQTAGATLSQTNPLFAALVPSTLIQSGTAAVNTGVTVTLPAVASQFHYITSIEVNKFYSVLGVAAAAPVLCTTTNLPGSFAMTFDQSAATQGTMTTKNYNYTLPLKSSTVNTATTIVCPVQLQTIWRINVSYYAAP